MLTIPTSRTMNIIDISTYSSLKYDCELQKVEPKKIKTKLDQKLHYTKDHLHYECHI